MVTIPYFRQNALLAGLPKATLERLAPNLRLMDMPLGKVLYEPGERLSHAYFPTNSIIAKVYVTEHGDSTEISMVGNEGMIGVYLFMGGESTTSRGIVQSAGHAFQLPRQTLMAEFNRGEELEQVLLLYAQALVTQIAQTAVCNRHHTIDQRLCRWLLLALDRLVENRLIVTQELIASMLGVRREGITEAAGKLQRQGVIEYHRGRVTVIDRPRLERLSCECYRVVKKETDRLLQLPLDRGHRHRENSRDVAREVWAGQAAGSDNLLKVIVSISGYEPEGREFRAEADAVGRDNGAA